MRFILITLLVTTIALATAATWAEDINFGGYARSEAMGGAGLAMSDISSQTAVLNPACGVASGARLRFVIPSFDYHTSGASLNDFMNRSNDIQQVGTDQAISLAEEFGKQPTSLTMGAMTGVEGLIGITAEGEAQGIITPGAQFTHWVLAGHPTTVAGLVSTGLITSASGAAAYATNLTSGTAVNAQYVYALPAISYGMGFKTSGGKLWAGAKAKFLHSECSTWNFAAGMSGANLNLTANQLSDMKSNGFGADFGFIFQPSKSKVQYGMVIDNAVKPSLDGILTPMMISVGAAARIKPNLSAALDVVNINRAKSEYSENTQLRAGIEWRVTRGMALRGGYSGSCLTYGFGLYGMDFAFSANSPNIISRTLKF